jgi:hypothetical protein
VSARRALGALALASATATLAAGCFGGGDGSSADVPPAATAPAAAAPVSVATVAPGGTVVAGPKTPKPVARALAGSKVVVVAFVVKGPADDASVAAALRAVQTDRGARSSARFFVYTVGKDSFGDLADLLGVGGTPAVAVIGRDRTLVNLWTGLVDAEILRQSISDAADTAAAHPAGSGATAARASTGGATGDPAGIELAEKANSAYADIPGVKATGSFPVDGMGTMGVEGTLRLSGGKVTAMSGDFSFGGARFRMVASPQSASITTEGAGCWARLPGGAAAAATTPDPVVTLPAGARVSKPRREGRNRLIEVSAGGQTATYVIDARTSELREVRLSEGTLAFTPLDESPAMPDASPVCDDPTKALEGLPAALGGTS